MRFLSCSMVLLISLWLPSLVAAVPVAGLSAQYVGQDEVELSYVFALDQNDSGPVSGRLLRDGQVIFSDSGFDRVEGIFHDTGLVTGAEHVYRAETIDEGKIVRTREIDVTVGQIRGFVEERDLVFSQDTFQIVGTLALAGSSSLTVQQAQVIRSPDASLPVIELEDGASFSMQDSTLEVSVEGSTFDPVVAPKVSIVDSTLNFVQIGGIVEEFSRNTAECIGLGTFSIFRIHGVLGEASLEVRDNQLTDCSLLVIPLDNIQSARVDGNETDLGSIELFSTSLSEAFLTNNVAGRFSLDASTSAQYVITGNDASGESVVGRLSIEEFAPTTRASVARGGSVIANNQLKTLTLDRVNDVVVENNRIVCVDQSATTRGIRLEGPSTDVQILNNTIQGPSPDNPTCSDGINLDGSLFKNAFPLTNFLISGNRIESDNRALLLEGVFLNASFLNNSFSNAGFFDVANCQLDCLDGQDCTIVWNQEKTAGNNIEGGPFLGGISGATILARMLMKTAWGMCHSILVTTIPGILTTCP